MRDDVLLNKTADLSRCLSRIREEYLGHEAEFETELRRQDSVVLNLTRACETTIDIANHLVKTHHFGIPQTSREAFDLLHAAGMISPDLCQQMKNMVGFRNIAVHSYARLSVPVIRGIVERELGDFEAFSEVIFQV
ncbi:MAG TPA: DUF86 domain-containing protein [Saprospiraceae bacterium]|nr:DUF86 domain-containing protein [Saprospiraceae bacterium]HND87844.1 DUF86 domain-containing protein [Saprospiraceae bacterium]HNG89034.1 DUF86 domain-containing protein [Saprospiraceae bacterium]